MTDNRTEGDIAAYTAWRRDPNRITADDLSRPPASGEPRRFDNETEACRHCPTPDVHPIRIGGILTYEGRCDPDTCERHDHSALPASGKPSTEDRIGAAFAQRAADERAQAPRTRMCPDPSAHEHIREAPNVPPWDDPEPEAGWHAEARATPPALTPERLANAMAMEGYADPDPVEQWAAPVESARRILARLSASGESPEPSGEPHDE